MITLALALLLSLTATILTLVLCWQFRDWRLRLLLVLMIVVVFHQTCVVFGLTGWVLDNRVSGILWLDHWSELVVSGMTMLTVTFLASILREPQRVTSELIAQREILSQILRHIPHSVFWKDRESRFLGCNANLAREIGIQDPSEIIGKTDYDLSSLSGQADHYRQIDRQVMETGEPRLNLEESVTYVDGTAATVITSKVPLRDPTGNVIGVLGIFYDITERKQTEQALKNSEALYHSLVENVPQCIFRKDLSGRMIFVNQRYCQMQKITPNQVLGKIDEGVYIKKLADKYRADDRWVIETGGTLESVEDHLAASKKMIKVQVVKTPVRDAEGRITGVQGIFWDITDRIRAEQALRESEEKYRNLVERANDGICIIQSEIVVYANLQLAKIGGYDHEDVIGTRYFDYVCKDELKTAQDKYERHVSGEEVSQYYESAMRHHDGRRVEVEINAGLITYEGQHASLVFVRDITARKRAEEALRERDNALAHVSRLTTMGEMVAGIAHEINQPLYAIGNYATACARTLESNGTDTMEKLHGWMRQISKQASRAGGILRRLSDFSRKSTIHHSLSDLNDLIAESCELLNLDARRRQVSVQFDLAPSLPAIEVDAIQIQQVIVNLLQNAYEATAYIDLRPHEVTVRSQVKENSIKISIEDNGPGLPHGDVDKLFEAFFTTKPHGLGMGLAISRTIIKAHGGRIWTTENEPFGTAFHFTLPTGGEKFVH